MPTGADLDPRVRGQLRSVTIAAIAVLVVAVTCGWFLTPIGPDFIVIAMFGVVLLPALALIALGLIVIYVIEGRRIGRDRAVSARQRAAAFWSPVGAAVILMLIVPSACSAGAWGRRQVVLNALEPTFRQMMAASQSGRAIPVATHDGHRIGMNVEKGAPRRYYFQMAGLGDNGSGFVYDPTDAVLAARGWGPKQSFTAPPDIREWFGGDLLWCERVRGHYHYCGFT